MIRYQRGQEYIIETGPGVGVVYNALTKRISAVAPIGAWLFKGGWGDFTGDPGPIMAETSDATREEKYVDPHTAMLLKSGKWQDLFVTRPADTMDDVNPRESSSSSSA